MDFGDKPTGLEGVQEVDLEKKGVAKQLAVPIELGEEAPEIYLM
jgi:hypothetical protein